MILKRPVLLYRVVLLAKHYSIALFGVKKRKQEDYIFFGVSMESIYMY